MEYGSARAMKDAIANVERWFPVVGILEDMDASFKIMEKMIPTFFREADLVRKGVEKEGIKVSKWKHTIILKMSFEKRETSHMISSLLYIVF